MGGIDGVSGLGLDDGSLTGILSAVDTVAFERALTAVSSSITSFETSFSDALCSPPSVVGVVSCLSDMRLCKAIFAASAMTPGPMTPARNVTTLITELSVCSNGTHAYCKEFHPCLIDMGP